MEMRNQGRATPSSEADYSILVYVLSPNSLDVMLLLTFSGEYWVVNQILAKQLHHADQEVMGYTLGLMDKLEQVCIPVGSYDTRKLADCFP